MRDRSPSTKFIFSVGGWTAGSEVFSRIASSAVTRSRFAQSVLNFTNHFGFDGMDLDWEFPGQGKGSDPVNDRENFVLLCMELHRVLNAAGKEFSIAVAAAEWSARISYDIPRVAANVDSIKIMTYDFHGSWNNFTGIHGAMYPGASDVTAFQRQLNVNASVNFWISEGAPRSKILVGMPAYGRSWTLDNPGNNGVNALAQNPGNVGDWSEEAGFLGYNEICRNLAFRGWTRQWDSARMTPFAFFNNQWVGYDDLQSIEYKCNFVISNNLAGTMWWSIETEDFLNICGQGHSPLIRLSMNMMSRP